MKTIKEILTENRDSVISSIKWIFKIYKLEDVKTKMIEVLAYCEQNANIENLNKSVKIKTDLKFLVQKMAADQQKERNLKIYGTEKPKLADIMSKIADRHESQGKSWNPIIKEWVKSC